MCGTCGTARALSRYFVGGLFLLLTFNANAQAPLPKGLTCGLSYSWLGGGVDNLCRGFSTGTVGGAVAPGYFFVFDGDVGDSQFLGYAHQERSDGIDYTSFSPLPPGAPTNLPPPQVVVNPTDFVLPRGAVCGFHHTLNSQGRLCMGFNAGLDPALQPTSEPPPPPPLEGVPVLPGCPDGWKARKAFDMSSGAWYWVWCEYQDPMHRSIGGPPPAEAGITCGVAHNGIAYTNEDPGPTCMGYRPADGTPPVCPPGTKADGWYDQGRPGGIGLGFCTVTLVPFVMPPPAPARGFLDTTSTTTGVFSGWAFDPNAPETSIFVDLYIDGPAGSGAPAYRVVANAPRSDVDSYFGIPGDHGYSFTLPSQYLSASHTVYAYGISLFGQANPLLAQSPGTYSPPAPPPPPPPLCNGCLIP